MTDDEFKQWLQDMLSELYGDEDDDTPDKQEDRYIDIKDHTVAVGYIPGAERLTTYSVERLQKALELLEVLEVETVDVLTIEDHTVGSVMLAFEPKTDRHRITGETYVMAAPRVIPGDSDE